MGGLIGFFAPVVTFPAPVATFPAPVAVPVAAPVAAAATFSSTTVFPRASTNFAISGLGAGGFISSFPATPATFFCSSVGGGDGGPTCDGSPVGGGDDGPTCDGSSVGGGASDTAPAPAPAPGSPLSDIIIY